MKKTILYVILAFIAIWFSFYTENLTEKKNREAMSTYSPEQLVGAMMRDSLDALRLRSIDVDELSKALSVDGKHFTEEHGRVLGIGSPTTYVVSGTITDVALIDDEELQGLIGGIRVRIPVKYVFGNTARDASGWFDIDDFRNTMDFNAVSAAMNKHIAGAMKIFSPNVDSRLDLLGAIAIKDGILPPVVTIIPYEIKTIDKAPAKP